MFCFTEIQLFNKPGDNNAQTILRSKEPLGRELSGGLVKTQSAGHYLQSFWFSTSKVRWSREMHFPQVSKCCWSWDCILKTTNLVCRALLLPSPAFMVPTFTTLTADSDLLGLVICMLNHYR